MPAQSLAAGLFPTMWYPMQGREKTHLAAAENLARARAEALEFGAERRRAIRRRVREMREKRVQEMREKEKKEEEDVRLKEEEDVRLRRSSPKPPD